MAVAKRSYFGNDDWFRAWQANQPTAEQKRLLRIWNKVSNLLEDVDTECVFKSAKFDFETRMHHLEKAEDGTISVGVTVDSTVTIPLSELVADSAERAAIEREFQRLIATKQA
jgi:hypothetical protein